MKKLEKVVEKATWNEFRETGLFQFINTILHAFGWVIVVEVDQETKEVTKAYPCRTKWRGFNAEDNDEMYSKIANYLADTAPNFPEEIK